MSLLKSFRAIFLSSFLLFTFQEIKCQNADINLLKAINPGHPGSAFWKATTDSYVIVALATSTGSMVNALVRKDRELKLKSLEIFGAIGITVVATEALKRVTNRERPYDRYPNDIFITSVSNGSSFPSGHTSLAFATATALSLAYPRWYVVVPAYTYAALMGYSRMYLGKHYPTDVLGGAVIGAGSSVLSHWVTKKLFAPAPANSTATPAF